MLEEDASLAIRLAIEEIRALDIFHGDRALALRLQQEEERSVCDALCSLCQELTGVVPRCVEMLLKIGFLCPKRITVDSVPSSNMRLRIFRIGDGRWLFQPFYGMTQTGILNGTLIPPVRTRPSLDLRRMTENLNVFGVARRAFSRIRVASPSRHAIAAVTVSPVVRIRESLSHR